MRAVVTTRAKKESFFIKHLLGKRCLQISSLRKSFFVNRKKRANERPEQGCLSEKRRKASTVGLITYPHDPDIIFDKGLLERVFIEFEGGLECFILAGDTSADPCGNIPDRTVARKKEAYLDILLFFIRLVGNEPDPDRRDIAYFSRDPGLGSDLFRINIHVGVFQAESFCASSFLQKGHSFPFRICVRNSYFLYRKFFVKALVFFVWEKGVFPGGGKG